MNNLTIRNTSLIETTTKEIGINDNRIGNVSIEKLVPVKPKSINIYQVIRDKMKFDEKGKCCNAFEILCSGDILLLAYNSIKSNPGNMTEGIDSTTLDGINMD